MSDSSVADSKAVPIEEKSHWRREVDDGFSPFDDLCVMFRDPDSGECFIYHPRPKERTPYTIIGEVRQ